MANNPYNVEYTAGETHSANRTKL